VEALYRSAPTPCSLKKPIGASVGVKNLPAGAASGPARADGVERVHGWLPPADLANGVFAEEPFEGRASATGHPGSERPQPEYASCWANSSGSGTAVVDAVVASRIEEGRHFAGPAAPRKRTISAASRCP
jgi:hypothetical protein